MREMNITSLAKAKLGLEAIEDIQSGTAEDKTGDWPTYNIAKGRSGHQARTYMELLGHRHGETIVWARV